MTKRLPLLEYAGLSAPSRAITSADLMLPDRPAWYVAAGIGRDSTGMLVELWRRGLRPDAILFADTGGEKPETYAYIPVLDEWLHSVDFPSITVVRHNARQDSSLEANCLRLGLLPSQAFNLGTCSDRWKQGPQRVFINHWQPALQTWGRGQRVVRAIGFEATECRRIKRAETYREKSADTKYDNWYPLREWGMTLDDCIRAIISAGLPVPPKSACFFCPASKPEEVEFLARHHPDLLIRSLVIERRAMPKLIKLKGLGGRHFAWRDLPCSAPFLDEVERLAKVA